MENGFVYVLVILFAVALCSFIAYDPERARASRTALGVILLAALSALLSDVALELKDITYSGSLEYEDAEGADFAEQSMSDALERGIRLAVAEKFSFSEENVFVECRGFDLETVSAERISITLSGRAALADIRAVREYVEGEGLGDCEVRVVFE